LAQSPTGIFYRVHGREAMPHGDAALGLW